MTIWQHIVSTRLKFITSCIFPSFFWWPIHGQETLNLKLSFWNSILKKGMLPSSVNDISQCYLQVKINFLTFKGSFSSTKKVTFTPWRWNTLQHNFKIFNKRTSQVFVDKNDLLVWFAWPDFVRIVNKEKVFEKSFREKLFHFKLRIR